MSKVIGLVFDDGYHRGQAQCNGVWICPQKGKPPMEVG